MIAGLCKILGIALGVFLIAVVGMAGFYVFVSLIITLLL